MWVARTLARDLGNAELISIARQNNFSIDSEVIGFVFPVHIWGVPPRIIEFVRGLRAPRAAYIFAVAVNAGQVANTLVQLKKILRKNGWGLSSGFEIPLPSNYIPWGGPGPRDKQNQRFQAAEEKISKIAATIKARENRPVEKGPLWQRVLFTLFYKMSVPQIPAMDRKFWVDEKCNQCGICSKVCPSENVHIHEGKPVWDHHCEQCFACLQWCPREAIQYGRKTSKYDRYHHPAIQLKDIL